MFYIFLMAISTGIFIMLFVLMAKVGSNDKSSKLEQISRDLTVMSTRLDELSKGNMLLYQTVEKKLGEIRADNEKRLEEMRQTVDEKLQKTLESRLSTTFKAVSDQLESVYKQLGEMQNLAKGVGNLEKVLTNVKTRGMWGELQAERILQEILLPEQYLKNVVTRKGGKDPVEFAVKLPGAEEGQQVLMPIDSKFPREDYERICDATESGDVEVVKACRKALEDRIKFEAKQIQTKYIDVPNTTDFAVLFLPIEGLYAEVLAIPGLQELVQKENHIMIAGPTTLASLLNSLQMGFRTLAIEKKSAEVWQILGQVKTEFGRFETVLQKVQKKLTEASHDVDEVFHRQQMMGKKLRNVEAIEVDSTIMMLPAEGDDNE